VRGVSYKKRPFPRCRVLSQSCFSSAISRHYVFWRANLKVILEFPFCTLNKHGRTHDPHFRCRCVLNINLSSTTNLQVSMQMKGIALYTRLASYRNKTLWYLFSLSCVLRVPNLMLGTRPFTLQLATESHMLDLHAIATQVDSKVNFWVIFRVSHQQRWSASSP
jgi:hypothetical protein